MKVVNINKYNPYLEINQNEVYLANGDYALVYTIDLIEKYALSENDYNLLINYWFKGFKNLPINTIVFKQDIFLNSKYDSEHIPGSHFLRKYTRQYFKGRKHLKHLSVIYFILPQLDTFKNESIKNPFVIFKKLTKNTNRINTFKRSVETNIDYFNSNKINKKEILFNPVNQDFLEWLKTSFFNGFQEGYLTDFKAENKDIIEIGDLYYSNMCLTHEVNFPDSIETTIKDNDFSSGDFNFYKNYGEDFGLSLEFNHIYNQIFFIDDSKRHLDNIKDKHTKFVQARSFSPENKILADNLEETIKDIVQSDNNNFCRGHNSIIYWSDNKDDLEKYKNDVISKFRQNDFVPYYPTGNNKNSLFYSAFFGYTSSIPNRFLYYTDLKVAISLINNTTNFKSDNKGIILNDRIYNLPINVDTWDEDKKHINARNFFVIAPTGSGKSFLANHLFSQYYEQGVALVIIDLGGSYEKLSYLYPKETVYIRYKEGESLNINPFYIDNVGNINTIKINELSQFVFLHTKRSEEPTEVESNVLRLIIKKYYDENHENHSFPNFINWVKYKKNNLLIELNTENRFFDIEEFILLLNDFVGEGLYSFLYKNNDDDSVGKLLGKKFIVFELDEAKNDKILLSILLQLISITIQNTIWEDKKNKGLIFFDEASKQLEFPNVLNQIAYINQTIRKYNGAIGLALQTINQLPNNEKAKSIIENTQILYVLKNDRGYQDIKERFNLTTHQLYQMMSISDNFKSKNPYSSVFVLRGTYGNVYHLQVPKEVFWAYQTEGATNEKLLEKYREIGDMEEAILTHIKELKKK